ncbi:hypothetical protein [Olleya marilimosa]|uniref:hypothetical protein n=1 Tax=Olleya marilimosa TaxID=272164 RepID=UPI0030EF5A17|tara:strand:- start:73397 stop:75982 length:2586 start_codon:yes stop_codon:yes gene_type:complete
MAEQINIAELKIDNSKLLSSLSATKKSIEELTKTQKTLKDNNDTTSESFIKNEAALKTLKQEYNAQQKVLQATTKATSTLNSALDKEVKTLDGAKANNKELREIRNQLNSETAEGAKAIESLNAKVDENTKYIEENVDALENQKMQVGDYKTQIKEAYNELNPMNGGLAEFANKSKEAGGAGNLFKSAVGGVTTGIKSMTKAAIGFIATPVGAILAALVLAFTLVKNAMNRSEEATNKITRVFSAFGGIVSGLLGALEPLGTYLVDGIAKGFELAAAAAEGAMSIISSGLSLLGFDGAAESVDNFTENVKEAAKAGQALADAEAQLQKEQRKSEKIQLDYQKQAEKLRQIRDDETKSTAERQKANEDLGLLLKEQSKEEIRIARLALTVADLRIAKEGETTDALNARGEALTKIAEIEERITSQESEQLTNRNSIIKDGQAKAKEASDKRIAQMEAELALLEEQNRFAAKSEEEKIKQLQVYADKEVDILKAKLNNKTISETQYQTEVLKLENDIKAKKAEVAKKEKLDDDTKKQEELDRLKTFDAKKRELENELALSRAEDEQAKAELKVEQDYKKHLLELENMELNADEKLELEKLLLQRRNDALAEIRKEAVLKEIDAKAKITQDELNADKAKSDALIKNQRTLSNTLLTILGDTVAGRVASIIAEGVFAVAQIKTNAAQANAQIIANTQIANAKSVAASPLTGGFPMVAFNTAQQIKGIAANNLSAGINIASVLASSAVKAVKFERGGILNGPSHAQGGIQTPYGELEGGEAIINKRSTALYAPLLSEINAAGGGKRFAQGGIIGATTTAPSTFIDYDLLAGKIAQANLSLPSPIVSVSEINTVSNQVNAIETTATF